MGDKKEDLIKIVGAGNVFDDGATMEAYAKDSSFTPTRKPDWLVRVKNIDEVEAVVRWANATRTPLVPVSSGPPHFRGDTVPTAGGAVIVDLSQMKRIIHIDRRSRMIIIEPGVTFDQLQPELAKNDLRLSTPLLPRANKSVVASLLEREPTLTTKYQWSLLEPLRCLELVWGNGERFLTGEAGDQRTQPLEAQWKKGIVQMVGLGPGQIDYYRLVSGAQGSMAIVTWASVKCEILPKVHNLFFIQANKLEDLIDCAYRIGTLRLGDEFLLLNKTALASIVGRDSKEIAGLKQTLPSWVIIVGVAGRDILPEERVAFQEHDIREIAEDFGLELLAAVPGVTDDEALAALLKPSADPYWKLRAQGGFQDVFFLTTLDRTPGFIRTVEVLAAGLKYPVSDIGVYLQPQHQGTSCHCEFILPYHHGVASEEARLRQLLTEASAKLIDQEAFFSRPYGIWADMAYRRDEPTASLLKKVKGIFDPNNVMNPGKLCFQAIPDEGGR